MLVRSAGTPAKVLIDPHLPVAVCMEAAGHLGVAVVLGAVAASHVEIVAAVGPRACAAAATRVHARRRLLVPHPREAGLNRADCVAPARTSVLRPAALRCALA